MGMFCCCNYMLQVLRLQAYQQMSVVSNFALQRKCRAAFLEFSSERAMLERGEQRVKLCKMGAVGDLEGVNLGNAGGEGLLEVDGRDTQLEHSACRQWNVFNG